MTKRYNFQLIVRPTDGPAFVSLDVRNKTMDTVQQIIRLAMSDLEKVDRIDKPKLNGGVRVDPPIEPTDNDIKSIK